MQFRWRQSVVSTPQKKGEAELAEISPRLVTSPHTSEGLQPISPKLRGRLMKQHSGISSGSADDDKPKRGMSGISQSSKSRGGGIMPGRAMASSILESYIERAADVVVDSVAGVKGKVGQVTEDITEVSKSACTDVQESLG